MRPSTSTGAFLPHVWRRFQNRLRHLVAVRVAPRPSPFRADEVHSFPASTGVRGCAEDVELSVPSGTSWQFPRANPPLSPGEPATSTWRFLPSIHRVLATSSHPRRRRNRVMPRAGRQSGPSDACRNLRPETFGDPFGKDPPLAEIVQWVDRVRPRRIEDVRAPEIARLREDLPVARRQRWRHRRRLPWQAAAEVRPERLGVKAANLSVSVRIAPLFRAACPGGRSGHAQPQSRHPGRRGRQARGVGASGVSRATSASRG